MIRIYKKFIIVSAGIFLFAGLVGDFVSPARMGHNTPEIAGYAFGQLFGAFMWPALVWGIVFGFVAAIRWLFTGLKPSSSMTPAE